MSIFRTLTLAVFAVSASPVAAQEAGDGCQMGNIAYSTGAGLAQGSDQILVCSDTGDWVPTAEGTASGCIHIGTHYGIGAFVSVALDGSLIMTCRADGVWRRYEAN